VPGQRVRCGVGRVSVSEVELIRREFSGALTEIVAGKVLLPKSDEEHAWNNASDRAIKIVTSYILDEGLFQK
jgi:hypothetical protein